MAKTTPIKEEQSFVYQLGQDVAKLGIEIEQLKNKTGKALRVSVPAKPDKYSSYELPATVLLPSEYQNAICIKTTDDNVELIKTTNSLTLSTTSVEQVIYIAPIYRLQEDNIQAAFNAEQVSLIDAEIERQERERKERQEREERERKERQEREEREKGVYKYLAKWLTDNYLEGVRAKAVNRVFENNGIKVYVNKNGLTALFDKPFERNSYIGETTLDESIYTDAKEAMLAEKARIDRGEVDLSVASDFEVVNYAYIKTDKDDYLTNTQGIICDLKAQLSQKNLRHTVYLFYRYNV